MKRSILLGLPLFCAALQGCATHQPLTLAHDVNVPKEFRSGNFSAEHPDYWEGNSAVERYVDAYERGWLIAVEEYANDINFDDPSPFVMNGWVEEAAGGEAGYGAACQRIDRLIELYGKQKVSAYLEEFRPCFPVEK